jgi:hypothetical protein
MKYVLWILAVLSALLVAALPVIGQQRAPARCAPVRQPIFRAMADSMMPPEPYIRTNGSPSTAIRDHVAARLDSVSCTPVKLDTVPVFVVQRDTLWCQPDEDLWVCGPTKPAGGEPIPLPPEDTVPDVPPDPPVGEKFDREFVRDTVISCPIMQTVGCDLVVPDGQRWAIKARVEIVRGSLRTLNGTVAIRDGGRVVLSGGNPLAYVGGGAFWTEQLGRTDYGVWIGGAVATGRLDIACTGRTPMSRTGQQSDWSSTDELWVTPTALGDFTPRRWTLGSAVPRADSLVPPAEILNVTRGCSVEGVGHVHIHSSPATPHRIENVVLRGLGVSNANGPVLGRYALHDHMSGEGSRNTVVRGVVAIDSRGTVFVPHMSHGITYKEVISLNSMGDGFFWDLAHETNDVLVEGMVVCGVTQGSHSAFVLGAGTNVEIRNSVACGQRGNDQGKGFRWPEPTPDFDQVLARLTWRFRGNVAHNNLGTGTGFWNNEQGVQKESHVVEDYVSYRNQTAGIENGAYSNCNQYRNLRLFQDGYGDWWGDMKHPAIIWQTNSGQCDDGARTARVEDAIIASAAGPAVIVGHRNVPAGSYVVYEDVTLMPAPGQPKVLVTAAGPDSNPWKAEFRGTNVQPADIVFQSLTGGNEGSHVIIDPDGDGPLKGWDVRVVGGKKVVSNR